MRPKTSFSLLGATLAAGLLIPSASPAGESLTLRVNDAIGAPGGLATVIVRTYSSRGVGQGQSCFAANLPALTDAADVPFAEFVGSFVFSEERDAQHRILPGDGSGQSFLLQFLSDTASINETDGPLAALYFRLSDSVVPGQEFILSIDPADSFLYDADGLPIPIEVRSGELEIRGPNAPREVSAEAEDTPPGGVAILSMFTAEPELLSGGQVGLRYDPAIGAGLPKVKMNPRHGNATFTVDLSEEGLVFVAFDSPDRTLNRLPGDLVEVLLPTDPDLPIGTRSPVVLDPELTFLIDADGNLLPIELEAGELELR